MKPVPFQILVTSDGARLSIKLVEHNMEISFDELRRFCASVDKSASPKRTKPKCAVCGRGLGICRLLNKKKLGSLPVKAFVSGEEVTLEACSKGCQTNAWKRFEKEKLCMENGLREIANARAIVSHLSGYLKERSKEPSHAVQPSPETESAQVASLQHS